MCLCVCVRPTAEGHGAPSLSHPSLGRPVGVDGLDGEQAPPPLATRPPLCWTVIGWRTGGAGFLLLVLLVFFFGGFWKRLRCLSWQLGVPVCFAVGSQVAAGAQAVGVAGSQVHGAVPDLGVSLVQRGQPVVDPRRGVTCYGDGSRGGGIWGGAICWAVWRCVAAARFWF